MHDVYKQLTKSEAQDGEQLEEVGAQEEGEEEYGLQYEPELSITAIITSVMFYCVYIGICLPFLSWLPCVYM